MREGDRFISFPLKVDSFDQYRVQQQPLQLARDPASVASAVRPHTTEYLQYESRRLGGPTTESGTVGADD